MYGGTPIRDERSTLTTARTSMVRRGSTVRVRQRATKKPLETGAFFHARLFSPQGENGSCGSLWQFGIRKACATSLCRRARERSAPIAPPRRSLGTVWVEAGGVKAGQRCVCTGRECAASANSRDDLADRFGGEVRLIARDRMTRLVGADENRRGRQSRNLFLRFQPPSLEVLGRDPHAVREDEQWPCAQAG